jgi:rod shape determining protein RodA
MLQFLTGRLVIVRLLLMLSTMALVGIGIASIYAVGHPASQPVGTAGQAAQMDNLWQKQLFFAAVGFIAFILVNRIDYRRLGEFSYWLYGIVIILLALLLVDKYIVNIPDSLIEKNRDTYRWIKIPFTGLSFQPSELCKVVYILALGWYLRYKSNYRKFSSLVGPFALTVLPMFLILREPDLGTVLLMMPILFTMLFVAGAKVRHLLTIIALAVLVSPLLWLGMEPYQKIRVSCVLLQNEQVRKWTEKSPTLAKILVGKPFSQRQWENDWGYHLIRSKYAIAAGGMNGYGFRKGPFIKYDFLPERQNDFIFAVIAQQWGFWGAVGLIAIYLVFCLCGLEIAAEHADPFGRLVAMGIVAMFFVELIVNISMTVGLMPITGLTLPFVSYGGSSLAVSLAAVGILNNIGRHRPFSVATTITE